MKFRQLSVFGLATLALSGMANAQEACIQVIQPAVSPTGICQEFSTPCEVPEDWKSVPSCDLIDNSDSNKPSLEHKMNSRLERMRQYWEMKKQASSNTGTDTATNKTFNRLGSGALTRSDRNHRLPTSSNASTDGVRTFTEKNYNSDIAERYSLRGGYEREGDTTSQERLERRQYRPSYMSRTDANREGSLSTTVKWDVLSDQFTTKKSYGKNPYRYRSQYEEAQAAKRAATNHEVDVYERMMSESRRYRGPRMIGNMSGDDLLEAETNTNTTE